MTYWVFLRGLTRESRHWGLFPELFRRALPECRVVCIDLPGNGCLNMLPSPRSVSEMASYCRDELARRGLQGPHNLLAMSLGAMVAVALASGHPDEVSRCVLINTSLKPFSPFYHRLRAANYPALLKLALLGGSPMDWESTILRLTSRKQAHPALLLREWLAYRSEFPVSRANLLRQLLAAARYSAPPIRPSSPMLILASSQDALVDSRCSLSLARAWQAPIAVHKSAGHDLPLDDGPWVAAQVCLWLEATAPGAVTSS